MKSCGPALEALRVQQGKETEAGTCRVVISAMAGGGGRAGGQKGGGRTDPAREKGLQRWDLQNEQRTELEAGGLVRSSGRGHPDMALACGSEEKETGSRSDLKRAPWMAHADGWRLFLSTQ